MATTQKLPDDVRELLIAIRDDYPVAYDRYSCRLCDTCLEYADSEGVIAHKPDCVTQKAARILAADDAAPRWRAVEIAAEAMTKARNENPRGDAYLDGAQYPIPKLRRMLDQNLAELDLALRHDNDVEDKLADCLNYLSFILHKYRYPAQVVYRAGGQRDPEDPGRAVEPAPSVPVEAAQEGAGAPETTADHMQAVIAEIVAERGAQRAQWGEGSADDSDPAVWALIIAKHAGRLAGDALDFLASFGSDSDEYRAFMRARDRAIKVSAVCVAFAECVDRGTWRDSRP